MLTPCIPMNTSTNSRWLQLATYGVFSHPYGRQHITKAAALQLAQQFKSLLHRFGWKYIPVYIGHPDDPNFANLPEHMNTREYGRVKSLKVDENGIWVEIKWNQAGVQLMNEGQYRYLSPRWLMKCIQAGSFTPVRLLSVGLTNQPNLPVKPIAAEAPNVEFIARLHQTRDEKQNILRFSKLVQQRMESTGESYPEAWKHVWCNRK